MPYQFTNLHIALVCDCLLANDTETLGLACIRPPLHVAKDNLRLWFDLFNQAAVSPTQWQSLLSPPTPTGPQPLFICLAKKRSGGRLGGTSRQAEPSSSGRDGAGEEQG